MPKRTIFTNITPLPPSISREVAIALLHNHDEMIELNPLVIEHHLIKTPREAPADEFLDCVWHELTDKIHYLPGGVVKGKVSYKACFHNIPNGLQTHVYAPMGLDIREKWSIGGSLPGEPPEPRELGLNTPSNGLYLREDCDMKCNIMLQTFVRKNLDNSHKVLVERILKKAERVEEHTKPPSPSASTSRLSTTGSGGFQQGSHMAQSQFSRSRQETFHFSSSSLPSTNHEDMPIHPAFRNDPVIESNYQGSTQSLPAYQSLHGQQRDFPTDMKYSPYQRQAEQQPIPSQSVAQQHHNTTYELPVSNRKEFAAELPGSTPEVKAESYRRSSSQRNSISELSAAETLQSRLSNQAYSTAESRESSIITAPSQDLNLRPSIQSQNARKEDNSGRGQYFELPASSIPKKSFEQQYQAYRP